MIKNTNAIEKIVFEMSYKDMLAAREKFQHRFKGYSLGQDTMEVVQMMRDYRADKVTEEEYKAFCLKYNLKFAREPKNEQIEKAKRASSYYQHLCGNTAI
jgi:hypothetical protein